MNNTNVMTVKHHNGYVEHIEVMPMQDDVLVNGRFEYWYEETLVDDAMTGEWVAYSSSPMDTPNVPDNAVLMPVRGIEDMNVLWVMGKNMG